MNIKHTFTLHPTSLLVITALILGSLQRFEAFTLTKLPTVSSQVNSNAFSYRIICHASSHNGDEGSDHQEEEEQQQQPSVEEGGAEMGIPCLPPIGQSSFSGEDDENVIKLNGGAKKIGSVVSDRFELQYTCNKCDTRNSHQVSRLAYQKGVVIAVCKGCMAKHLIADNLGWSGFIPQGGFTEGATNIENTAGMGDEVHRVTKDVFELENMLYNGPDLYSSESNVADSIPGSACSDTDGAFE